MREAEMSLPCHRAVGCPGVVNLNSKGNLIKGKIDSVRDSKAAPHATFSLISNNLFLSTCKSKCLKLNAIFPLVLDVRRHSFVVNWIPERTRIKVVYLIWKNWRMFSKMLKLFDRKSDQVGSKNRNNSKVKILSFFILFPWQLIWRISSSSLVGRQQKCKTEVNETFYTLRSFIFP